MSPQYSTCSRVQFVRASVYKVAQQRTWQTFIHYNRVCHNSRQQGAQGRCTLLSSAYYYGILQKISRVRHTPVLLSALQYTVICVCALVSAWQPLKPFILYRHACISNVKTLASAPKVKLQRCHTLGALWLLIETSATHSNMHSIRGQLLHRSS
jgi:hypothetical protein